MRPNAAMNSSQPLSRQATGSSSINVSSLAALRQPVGRENTTAGWSIGADGAYVLTPIRTDALETPSSQRSARRTFTRSPRRQSDNQSVSSDRHANSRDANAGDQRLAVAGVDGDSLDGMPVVTAATSDAADSSVSSSSSSSTSMRSDDFKPWRPWLSLPGFAGCAAIFTVVLACLTLVLWNKVPIIVEGAFSYALIAQNNKTMWSHRLQLYQRQAVSNWTGRVNVNDRSYVWRYVDLIYLHAEGANLVEPDSLRDLRELERQIVSLPMWQYLCNNQVPPQYRSLCKYGDSLPSLYFGSPKAPSEEEERSGVVKKLIFDGEGPEPVMRHEFFLKWLEWTSPGNMQRWIPPDNLAGVVGSGNHVLPSMLRSSFFFLLPSDVATNNWRSFAQHELEPLLENMAALGESYDREYEEEKRRDKTILEAPIPPIRIFFRGDGLGTRGIGTTIQESGYRAAIMIGVVLLVTLVLSRRLLLSLAAAFIALAAPFVGALISSRHATAWQGFWRSDPQANEVHVMVLMAGCAVSAVSVDLALGALRAWESHSPPWPWWLMGLNRLVLAFEQRLWRRRKEREQKDLMQRRESLSNMLAQQVALQRISKMSSSIPDHRDTNYFDDDAGSKSSGCGSESIHSGSDSDEVTVEEEEVMNDVRDLVAASNVLRLEDFSRPVVLRLLEIYGDDNVAALRDALATIYKQTAVKGRSSLGDVSDTLVAMLDDFTGRGYSKPAATASGFTTRPTDEPPVESKLERFMRSHTVHYRVAAFCAEAFGAPLSCALVLLAVSYDSVIWLQREFTQAAGIGIIFAIALSAVLCPVAVELGDLMEIESEASCVLGYIRKRLHPVLVPVECGVRFAWKKILRRNSVYARLAGRLSSKWARAFAFVVVLANLALLTRPDFLEPETWTAFVGSDLIFDATMPDLFVANHRARIGPFLKAFYDPPSDDAAEEIIDRLPQQTLKCTVDAELNEGCSLTSCQVSQQERAPANMCRCYKQLTKPVSGAPCDAAARLFFRGDNTPFDFIQNEFWPSIESQVGTSLGAGANASKESTTSRLPVFAEMENWFSGERTIRTQFASGVSADWNGSMPVFGEACLRLLCFCADDVCKLANEWSYAGDVPYTAVSGPTRRLSDEHGGARTGYLDDNTARNLRARNTLNRDLLVIQGDTTRTPLIWQDRERRRLSSEDILASGSVEELYATWGIRWPLEPPHKMIDMSPDFLPAFQISNPWTQRSIYKFCAGVAPDLGVISTSCWILDFEQWLLRHSKRFPVPMASFQNEFHGFLSDFAHVKDDLGHTREVFWVRNDGTMGATYAVFKVLYPHDKEGRENFVKAWDFYEELHRNATDTLEIEAVVAMPWRSLEVQSAAVSEAAKSLTIRVSVVVCVIVFCITGSVSLSVAVGMSLATATMWVTFLLIFVVGRSIGALEVVALCAFLSLTLTPLIRIALQYDYCTRDLADDPHAADGPRSRGGGKRQDKSNQVEEKPKFRPRSQSTQDSAIAIMEGIREMSSPFKSRVHLWMGAVEAERVSRVSYSLEHAGGTVIGFSTALMGIGFSLNDIPLQAAERYSLVLIGVSSVALPVSLALLPVLLLFGFGPSKVKKKALMVLVIHLRRIGWRDLADDEIAWHLSVRKTVESPQEEEASQQGILFEIMDEDGRVGVSVWRQLFRCITIAMRCSSALLLRCARWLKASVRFLYWLIVAPDTARGLGRPKGIVAIAELGFPCRHALRLSTYWRKFEQARQRRRRERQKQQQRRISTCDEGEESIVIRSLDLHGAALAPPFHVALPTHGCVAMTG